MIEEAFRTKEARLSIFRKEGLMKEEEKKRNSQTNHPMIMVIVHFLKRVVDSLMFQSTIN